MTLNRRSGLDKVLESTLTIDAVQYCLYDDLAYILRPWLQNAFLSLGASAAQVLYNINMNSVREALEWNEKDLKQLWTSQDFKRKLHVLKSPFALLLQSSG